jgi:peptidoglycan hydrolase-like protein with peptidoglycan-binding domain
MATVTLIYPIHGRGAWSSVGGTLRSDGLAPGSYYRAPAGTMQMPGIVGYKAVQSSGTCDINSYAIYMGVKGIQRELAILDDGLFGPQTGAALKAWQAEHSLEPDGVYGPASAKVMFAPVARSVAAGVNTNPIVAKLTVAHVGFESSWDPGAVGYVEPRDLGLGQINGPAHSDLTPQFRLTARYALSWVANFVYNNLEAMLWNERDAIAAYNLGVGGARSWVRAGRPDVWNNVKVKQYIDGVLTNA